MESLFVARIVRILRTPSLREFLVIARTVDAVFLGPRSLGRKNHQTMLFWALEFLFVARNVRSLSALALRLRFLVIAKTMDATFQEFGSLGHKYPSTHFARSSNRTRRENYENSKYPSFRTPISSYRENYGRYILETSIFRS